MALKTARQDIDYYNGDSMTKSYTVTLGGVAVDLSGDSLILTIKKTKKGTAIATLSTATGTITVSGADNNIVNLIFNNEFDEERIYLQDLYNITDDDTIWYGNLNVTLEVHD